jgi:glutathione S-transferase
MQTKTTQALLQACLAGHRLVLLLGRAADRNTATLDQVERDLAQAGRAVHRVRGARLEKGALRQPDPQALVAIDGPLSSSALRAIDAHLREPTATQLLVAGAPSLRDATAAPGLSRLHFAPFIVTMPIARAEGIAERPWLAALLDRPLIPFAGAFALAVAAFATVARTGGTIDRIAPRAAFVAPPLALPVSPGDSSVVTVDHEDPEALVAPRTVVARQGDTLASLYERVYRDHAAPGLDAVRALNPKPMRPGSRVVFPAPVDGWAPP